MRLQLIQQNLAKKTNNFEEVDKEYAYIIWIAEKEFNVGPITDDFLALKLFNLVNPDNIQRYNDSQKGQSKGKDGIPNTFR